MSESVTIQGNVGGEPELRFTPKGKAVVNFSVAVRAGEDEKGNELTTWVRCTVWGSYAEDVNKEVGKGDFVRLYGYLKPPELYETKDGQKKCAYEMVAFKVVHLERSFTEREILRVSESDNGKVEEVPADIPF